MNAMNCYAAQAGVHFPGSINPPALAEAGQRDPTLGSRPGSTPIFPRKGLLCLLAFCALGEVLEE